MELRSYIAPGIIVRLAISSPLYLDRRYVSVVKTRLTAFLQSLFSLHASRIPVISNKELNGMEGEKKSLQEHHRVFTPEKGYGGKGA